MSLFSLSPLKGAAPSLPQLSPSKAQFTLPPLDEQAPGVERLLGSLREGLLIASAHEAPFESVPRGNVNDGEGASTLSPTGDDGAPDVVDEEGLEGQGVVEGKPAAEQELWAQAALAGPSRVEVGRHL